MRKALHLLGLLSDEDMDWIATNSCIQQLPSGTTLIAEGIRIEHLFILMNGRMSVVNAKTLVATLLPGEILGEISYVDSRPPSASVTADLASTVLAISRATLNSHLATNTAFAARFYRAIASFLADRLYLSVMRLGYGTTEVASFSERDEIPDDMMEELSQGALRFDRLQKRFRLTGSYFS